MSTILKRMGLLGVAILVVISMGMPQGPTLRCQMTQEVMVSCCCASTPVAGSDEHGLPSYGQAGCCCQLIAPVPQAQAQPVAANPVGTEVVGDSEIIIAVLDERYSPDASVTRRAQREQAKMALGNRPRYQWFCSYLM